MSFSNSVIQKLFKYGVLDQCGLIDQCGLLTVNHQMAVLEAARRQRMMMIISLRQQKRKDKYQEHRRNGVWEEHVKKCLHKDQFHIRYHMTKESFDKLVELLSLAVDERKSRNSTGGVHPIDKYLIVASGLRWVGGESYKSIADIFHIDISSARRVVKRFFEAVIDCDALSINLPKEEELQKLADGWTEKSTGDGVFHGAVLMLDGFLSSRTKPACTNSADYFSGHKKIFALNVQALCDHNLRFRYVCVAAPGKTNDIRAFGRCNHLQQWLQALPEQYFIGADAAYPLSNQILIPFKGPQRHEQYKSSYNFYLSQLRIRIEMAFGRMTTKFRVMRGKMTCSLQTQSKVIQVVTRLHNFIIDNDGLPSRQQQVAPINEAGGLDAEELELMGIDPLENEPAGNVGFISVPYDANEGQSARRVALLSTLTDRTIVRPRTLRND